MLQIECWQSERWSQSLDFGFSDVIMHKSWDCWTSKSKTKAEMHVCIWEYAFHGVSQTTFGYLCTSWSSTGFHSKCGYYIKFTCRNGHLVALEMF